MIYILLYEVKHHYYRKTPRLKFFSTGGHTEEWFFTSSTRAVSFIFCKIPNLLGKELNLELSKFIVFNFSMAFQHNKNQEELLPNKFFGTQFECEKERKIQLNLTIPFLNAMFWKTIYFGNLLVYSHARK